MKKKNLLSLCLSALLCAQLICPLTASASGGTTKLGDINGDGKINPTDYIALRKSLLSGIALPKNTADINGDGKINSADYVALRMHILGIKPIVEPENKIVRTAVSAGCSYKIDGNNAGKSYPDSYNIELTDGSYAPSNTTSYNNPKFVGLEKSGSITVDLGTIRNTITEFEFSFLSVNDAGIMPPSRVSVSISGNGVTWTAVGDMSLNTKPINGTDKATLEVSAPITAKFVRFTYTSQTYWVFVDEVTVYANMPAGDTFNVADSTLNAYKHDISDNERQANIKKMRSNIKVDTSKGLVSLSEGMPYSLSNKSTPFDAMKDNGKMLTDGNCGVTFEDGSFAAFYADKEQAITLDLGSVNNDISIFSLSAYLKAPSNVYLPSYVDIAVSVDGKSYYSIGRLYSPTSGTEGVYSFEYKSDYCIKARYIRYTVGASGGKYTLVSEVSASAYREYIGGFYPDVKLDTSDTGPWPTPTTTVTNLILGKKLQIEPHLNLQTLINPEYNTPATSKLLTDGKSAQSSYCYDGTWFHCVGASGRYFYFDLGHISALKYVSGGLLHNSSWGIFAPNVKIHLSEDGINWYSVGSYYPSTKNGERRDNFRITFDKTYKARFVCFDIEITSHAFLDELSVYGCKSTNGATALKDSGLKRFEKTDHMNTSLYYQAPSEDLLHGVNDVVLAYYNSSKLDEEFFRPYVGYIVDGKAKDTMFDGFLFLPNPSELINGGKPDFESDMEEWIDLEDKLFIKGQNLDALNRAAGRVKKELGLSNYKYKFFVSIAHPSPKVTNFGDINGDGKSESLASVKGRLDAVKWYVERFYSMYDPADYPNLEFAGWYWFHESMDINDGDPDVIKATSDYLHSIGDQLFWIPYFTAEGYTRWKEVGFDVCCMQPNYAFDESIGNKRLDEAAELIKMYNMCIEIETDGRALTEDIFFKKYLGYLSGGITNGYMKEAIHMYYEAGGLFAKAYKDPDRGRIMYDYTYQFIKKSLTGGPKAPQSVSLKCRKNSPLSHVASSDSLAEVVITQMPSHGTVTVNGDGSVTYYPGRDFVGTDSFKIAASDYIGLSEDAVITVQVG